MLARKPQDLSALRFRPPLRRGEMQEGDTPSASTIPSGFGAHLIHTIGGHTIDIGTLDAVDVETVDRESPITEQLSLRPSSGPKA